MTFEIKDYATLRRSVDELCEFLSAQEVSPDGIFDCKLVAFEMLGNVLKHSQGGARFHGDVLEGFVELKIVSNEQFHLENPVCSGVYEENGRGLFLVDSVCAERICTPDGAVVLRIKIRE